MLLTRWFLLFAVYLVAHSGKSADKNTAVGLESLLQIIYITK